MSRSAWCSSPPSSFTRSTSVVTVTGAALVVVAVAEAPGAVGMAAGAVAGALGTAPLARRRRTARCRCRSLPSRPGRPARPVPCPTPSTAGSPPSARRRSGRYGSGSWGRQAQPTQGSARDQREVGPGSDEASPEGTGAGGIVPGAGVTGNAAAAGHPDGAADRENDVRAVRAGGFAGQAGVPPRHSRPRRVGRGDGGTHRAGRV